MRYTLTKECVNHAVLAFLKCASDKIYYHESGPYIF